MSTIFCIAKNNGQAARIVERLRASGFVSNDISVLFPDRDGTRDLAIENSTKVPEGAAVGAGTGALVGGALGWMAGIGALAIPGLGPFIAAGPIMAALSGMAAGGTLGGLSGGLVGLGIPEYEAQQYEGKLLEGNILISVHAETSEEAARVRQVFTDEKGEDISTGSEAAVTKR